MTPDDVLKYYGSGYKFNKATKMSASSLINWMKLGYIPQYSQLKIEHLTKGELKTNWGEEVEKTKEEKNIYEAKQSLKAHIKFFESLIHHINGKDQFQKARAMFAAWCVHRYLNDGLISDIEKVMLSQQASNDPVN